LGADFLLNAVVADLAERLAGVERHFAVGVAFAGQTDALTRAILDSGKVDHVIRIEQTAAALKAPQIGGAVADEEALPIAPASIDLFVSALALQWTNDLPGALIQIRQALRPDGLFLAALTAGRTLSELREALFVAETEITGGASPRVIPAADVRESRRASAAGGLRAARCRSRHHHRALRFSLQPACRFEGRWGAANTLVERSRTPTARRLFMRAAEIYAERFSDPDRRIRASFEIVSLSGWAPHESQQQPARRGSAQVRLADGLGQGTREPETYRRFEGATGPHHLAPR
jgi:SAM-dependent methyltransferase